MRTRTTLTTAVVALLALTGCSSDSKPDIAACKTAMVKQVDQAITTGEEAVDGKRPAACGGVDDKTLQRLSGEITAEKTAEFFGDTPEDAAEPSTKARHTFLEALNDIDRRIVDGKDDKAVSRGLDQCSSIQGASGNEDKQVELVKQTLGRFTVDTRLPEIATPETGAEILAAVHQNLCPDF
ncbi:hypothetical protein [Streptomyces sp. TRM75563]|uniref:hypothetical protein n=1 Tax=Streptomyces sp. TRM75563 TaxID=2817418 RepID=UPI001F6210E2|nr:hypothetical protein [Streptomyces sp. TRM75563]MCI4042450.1 hypothetical protein [Streptomyces sp. TRM75563]